MLPSLSKLMWWEKLYSNFFPSMNVKFCPKKLCIPATQTNGSILCWTKSNMLILKHCSSICLCVFALLLQVHVLVELLAMLIAYSTQTQLCNEKWTQESILSDTCFSVLWDPRKFCTCNKWIYQLKWSLRLPTLSGYKEHKRKI